MKKIADQVVLVAHICISAIFVIIALLVFVNIIPLNIVEGALVVDGFVLALVAILAILYLVLSVYLIYVTFISKGYLKEVLLYNDATSTTNATATVIKKIAIDNSKLVSGTRVKKINIATDDKQHLFMTVVVNVVGEEVATSVDKLRCLLEDSYMSILGLRFKAINFKLNKVSSRYQPDLDKADKQAEELNNSRKLSQELFQQPYQPEQEQQDNQEEVHTQDQPIAEVVEDHSVVEQDTPIYGEPTANIEEDFVVEISDDEVQPKAKVDIDELLEDVSTESMPKPKSKSKSKKK